ncbi:MAG TPA: SCP2 sterol-binding domain-containing protein [Solirubrobacteraceae bacterium]|nr:SCP2 sterol-binding domain-containing protein [Solirubrobacteraceae bacterium]
MAFDFDPQRALEQLRRLAADAPAQLSDGVGRLLREASPERLEQIMRSPARWALLEGIFWQMPKRLDPRAAAGVQTTVLWTITGRSDGGADSWLLTVSDGTAHTQRVGASMPEAKLTVTMGGVELLKLVSGNLDPMSAYLKGQIKLSGDIMVAAKLAQIFRMPGAAQRGDGEPGPNGGGELDGPH